MTRREKIDLISRYIDETCDTDDISRLDEMIRKDADAANLLRDMTLQHALLRRLGKEDAEFGTYNDDARLAVIPTNPAASPAAKRSNLDKRATIRRRKKLVIVQTILSLAATALILLTSHLVISTRNEKMRRTAEEPRGSVADSTNDRLIVDTPKPDEFAGKLTKILGTVYYRKRTADQWCVATNEAILEAGGEIDTRGGLAEITFADGDAVVFNQATWIILGAGRINLRNGEAYCKIETGAGKRFSIVTADATVTVTGTRFNVNAGERGTEITVCEGTVSCSNETGAVALVAEQQLHIAGSQVSLGQPVTVNVDDIVAWALWSASSTEPSVIAFQQGLNPTPTYAGAEDTALYELQPDVLHSTEPMLFVDGRADGDNSQMRPLLRWNIEELPPESVVTAAEIVLEVADGCAGGRYVVYPLRRSWSAREANWRQAAVGVGWQVPGAEGELDRGENTVGVIGPVAEGTSVIELNSAGVALIQSWVNDPSTNNGVILLNPNFADGLYFHSSEAAESAKRPKLIVHLAARR